MYLILKAVYFLTIYNFPDFLDSDRGKNYKKL